MLSIIIPVLNQEEMSRECIQTVLENTEGEYEIIVIDNGSEQPFKTPFTGFHDIKIIRNEENKGFPVAVNQGLREAKGEKIILLNNDVTVPPKALNRLADWLEEFDIVGPITNYSAGMQMQEIGAYQDTESFFNEAEMHYEASKGEIEEVNFIIGFCMGLKKSVWEDIGDFDESLWPCSGEEIDFCFRAREKNYKIGIAHDVYVHHEGSVTFKDLEEEKKVNYDEITKRNDEHIAEKWGKDFWKYQSVDTTDSFAVKEGLNLNLGCGTAKLEGYVNIDYREDLEPDLVCDVIKGLPYEDSSVDLVRAHDFLEHIPIGKTIDVMNEIWRVLKPGGIFRSLTPDAEYGQGAYQDPTHVSFWVENSWYYYTDPDIRKFYRVKANFKTKSISRVQAGERVFHLYVVAEAVK